MICRFVVVDSEKSAVSAVEALRHSTLHGAAVKARVKNESYLKNLMKMLNTNADRHSLGVRGARRHAADDVHAVPRSADDDGVPSGIDVHAEHDGERDRGAVGMVERREA